jgi:hypothetical protein
MEHGMAEPMIVAHGWTRRAALATALLALTAVAAHGMPLTVAVDPAVPTWQDTLRVTVTGRGCAPSLGEAAWSRGTENLDIALLDSCPPGVDPAPFTASRELNELAGVLPLATTLRVSDGEGTVATPLRIYNVGTAGLTLPTLVSSTEILRITLVTDGVCPRAEPEVDGAVIRVDLDDCGASTLHSTVSSPAVGPLPVGIYELRVFDHNTGGLPFGMPSVVRRRLEVRDPSRCFPDDDHLCLHEGRFAVSGWWRAFDGSTGRVHALLTGDGEQSGLFWFFAYDKLELTVKVLDGCKVNGHWWTFLSSSSTVEYQVTVDDAVTGRSWTYRNERGHTPVLIADTESEVCP